MSNTEYQGLHNLVAPAGSRKKPKRLGRGESSGLGKTSGRGHKGQKARKSGNVRPGFEGGQNPLARRLPKRGFKNRATKVFQVVNVAYLNDRFEKDAVVDPVSLFAAGIINKPKERVKLLSQGDVSASLTIKVHAASAAAVAKIEKAGGKVEIIKQ